jgi:hypothetical protein
MQLAAQFNNERVFGSLVSLRIGEELIEATALSQQHCKKYHIEQT